MRTFLEVAQQGNFSRAAQKLGYSQAAVTIQIKRLEEELGIHLFDRIGKQTVLTHQGKVFYDYAASIIRDLELAKAAVTESRELTGTLTIGTIESICASIFPLLLERFHEQYPKVNVSIVLDSPDVLLNLMNKNSIDLVYLLDRRMYDTKWIKVLEEPEEAVFAASNSHPLARAVTAGRSLMLSDVIAADSFLLTEKDASYRFILDQYLAADGREIRPFLELGNTEFIIQFLKQGTGVSFLPEFSVKKAAAAGQLTIIPLEDFHMQVWRQILYHKDKWVTREMAAFIALAREDFD